MKISLYTITDCQFSKQEKEYLKTHNLSFEEKNLETNKEYLTEMLAVSNNFAGTPVTKIEKDDGQIVVLKGFTPSEFDQTLGYSQPTVQPARIATQSVAGEPVSTNQPTSPAPTPPTEPVNPPPPTPPATPVVEPPVQTPPVPPSTTTSTAQNPQLSSLLNDLESLSSDSSPSPQPTTASPTPAPATNLPNIPEPNFS